MLTCYHLNVATHCSGQVVKMPVYTDTAYIKQYWISSVGLHLTGLQGQASSAGRQAVAPASGRWLCDLLEATVNWHCVLIKC